MDTKIIAHKRKLRYQRALKIVEAQGISPNGQAHTYYVASQAGNGRYLAATPEAFSPIGRCTCRDFQDFARHHGFECKHIMAAQIHERAEAHAHDLAGRHGISLSQLENRLLSDLCAGVPEPAATKLVILLHATQRLRLVEAMEGER